MRTNRTVRRTLLIVWLIGVGCGGAFGAEKGKTAANVPRELAMRPLPTYRIAPPDVLTIEVLKLVPPQPYKASTYDVLQVRVVGTIPEQPIDGFFLVDGDGNVVLGPAYGKVRVVGLTMKLAEVAIEKKLKEVLEKPNASVQLSRSSEAPVINGEYLVSPDGTIGLPHNGRVQVMGKTIEEATAAIEKQLSKHFVAPKASVDVKQYNSKVFYVITDGAGMGDNVRRLPITGSDTVLDALSAVNGLSQVSSKRIWISRPTATNPAKGTILPVDYAAITQRGATATNYQILPGDRLFISGDKTIAFNNWLSKKTAPVERLMGVISLGASTIRSVEELWSKSSEDKPEREEPGE
jgi:polysaccharide biosynthesis/export protein